MTIWFDRSDRTVVVGCHACGSRELCGSQGAADNWAVDHVLRFHPVDDLERRRAVWASQKRDERRRRDTPGPL